MKISISIDLDDGWTFNSSSSFLITALKNIELVFDNFKQKPILFVVARDLPNIKYSLKNLYSKGFIIGNHSFSHLYNNEIDFELKKKEIILAHNSLVSICKDIKFYRAPGWTLDQDILNILNKLNYKVDFSGCIGITFIFLKILHSLRFLKISGAYGLISNILCLKKFNFYKIKNFPLKTIFFIPFYYSFHKFIPLFVLKVYFLMINKFYNNKQYSYIFHAKDFDNRNLNKTFKTVTLLKNIFEIESNIFFEKF